MTEERLTLVTDFGKLKAGDLVVVSCTLCGEKHPAMLLNRSPCQTHWGWDMGPGQCPPWAPHTCLTDFDVTDRRVYLVDTGLDRQETNEATQGAPRHETACPDAIGRELARTGR